MFISLLKVKACMIFFWWSLVVKGDLDYTAKISDKDVHPENQCNILSVKNFCLNFTCLLKSDAKLTKLDLSSSHACRNACCFWNEGPSDLAYWDRYHKCIIMSYDVLMKCPPVHDALGSSLLLFGISDRVPSELRNLIMDVEHRHQVQSLLGCNSSAFLCDNWQCVGKNAKCDGHSDCEDGSDEFACSKHNTDVEPRCIDRNGNAVPKETFYHPYGDGDNCKTCFCGKQIYCFSASCGPRQPTDGQAPSSDLCCHSRSGADSADLPKVTTDTPFINLTDTQRLVVSCMSVFIVVCLLLFLSRNILHRGEQPMHRGHGYFSRAPFPNHRLAQAEGFAHHRSFVGRYWRNSDSVSFCDHNEGPSLFFDLPPSYDELKPPENVPVTDSAETLGPPPSYPSESLRTEGNGEPAGTVNEERADNTQPSTNPTTSPPASPSHSLAPISPMSTTSETPLI